MNQKHCSHKWDGPTVGEGRSFCSSCSWCGVSYFDFINGIIPKESREKIRNEVIASGTPSYAVKQEVAQRIKGGIYYFWVGKRGYVFSSSKDSQATKKGDKLKCMGFSTDSGWPKRMNTGRLMHKPK